MSEYDPFAEDPCAAIPALPSLDKIDRQDTATDLAKQAVVRIDANSCEETGVCAQVCPEDVLEFIDGHINIVKPEACTECWICVDNCVSGAIDIG
jgi:MinD superfamily P-loop ATPase